MTADVDPAEKGDVPSQADSVSIVMQAAYRERE
jgi:hypothetical protein